MRFFCSDKKCQHKGKKEVGCSHTPLLEGSKPLSEVKVGDCVWVRRHTCCGKMRRRLLDLGLTPQAKVDVVRKAPLGDPIVLKIGDFDLILSESEALHVEVALAE